MRILAAKHYTDTTMYAVEQALKNIKLRLNQYLAAREPGITSEQFAVLDTICAGNNICQQDIAKLLGKDKSNIKRIVGILENNGYIAKSAGRKNNRTVNYLAITPAGQTVVDRNIEPIKQYMAELFSCVSDEEAAALRSVADKMKDLKPPLDFECEKIPSDKTVFINGA